MKESSYDPVIYEDLIPIEQKAEDVEFLLKEVIEILADDANISETTKAKLLNLLK